MSDQPGRQFSFIYKKLVKTDNDYVGMIAYSIYKAEKITFIESYKKSNGNYPSEKELYNFQAVHSSKKGLERIRERAEILFSYLSEEIISSKIRHNHDLLLGSPEEFKSKLKGLMVKQPWWEGILWNTLYNALGIVFLVLAFWALEQAIGERANLLKQLLK